MDDIARAAGMSKPVLYRQFLKRISEEYALARCWQRYAFRKGSGATGRLGSLDRHRSLCHPEEGPAKHCFCHCSRGQVCRSSSTAFDSVNIP